MPTYQEIYGSASHSYPPKPKPPEEEQPKRRAGRPKGVKNKPVSTAMTQQQLEKLYRRFEHMLDDDHKKYLNGVIKGKVNIDAVHESELLLRYLSILVTEALGWALESKSISRDLSTLVGEYRMGIKDLEDMRRRREEQKVKLGTEERLVDPTSELARSRLDDLVKQYTTAGTE